MWLIVHVDGFTNHHLAGWRKLLQIGLGENFAPIFILLFVLTLYFYTSQTLSCPPSVAGQYQTTLLSQ